MMFSFEAGSLSNQCQGSNLLVITEKKYFFQFDPGISILSGSAGAPISLIETAWAAAKTLSRAWSSM